MTGTNFSIEQLNLIFGKVLEIDENVLFSLNGIWQITMGTVQCNIICILQDFYVIHMITI